VRERCGYEPGEMSAHRSEVALGGCLSIVRRRFVVSVATAVALGFGCQTSPADEGPEAVVEEFVLRMQRVHGDDKVARGAYDLLWGEAKRALAERAKRASDVAGREVAPQAMLAPSRFSLSFVPRRYDARIDGDWAIVTAIGETASQRHEVKCVREDGRWRVVLVIPPLPPIQRREESESAAGER
jgi:hypothetical protein